MFDFLKRHFSFIGLPLFFALLIVGFTLSLNSNLSLSASSSSEFESSLDSSCFQMEKMSFFSSDSGFIYYRDTVTDVLYVWRKSGYSGGLTVMLDPATGFPLTYSRYLEIANNQVDFP